MTSAGENIFGPTTSRDTTQGEAGSQDATAHPHDQSDPHADETSHCCDGHDTD
jgi:hypothetical protein